MAMSQRGRLRRWLLVVALIALVCGAAGFSWLRPPRDDPSLDETLAALDRAEPGWRLADLLAARKPLPDDRNGAVCMGKAARLLPKSWFDWQLMAELADVPAEKALSAELADRVRRELGRARPALEEARRLIDLPAGRRALRYDPADPVKHLPDISPPNGVSSLLLLDALDRLHRRDATGALRSCRAALNVGRAVADEPLAISMLVRMACVRRTCQTVGRALAQTEPPPGELALVQAALAEEERSPMCEPVIRGERGFLHDQFVISAKQDMPLRDEGDEWGLTEAERKSGDLQRARLRAAHRDYLRLSARLLEIARLPPHQRTEPLAAWDKERQAVKNPAASWVKSLLTFEKAERRAKAEYRCLIVAIAAERYRQARGAWPATTDALVPAYLDAVPLDPFDGRPLRYRLADGGVIVYSVGPDGVDNKGRLAGKDPNEPGTDLGWRLWPTPRPPKPAEADR
jgi:hypothetical protein